MDFVALVDQVVALLRRLRVTYHALQRQFQLDAEGLADLPGELRYAHQEALREDEQGLMWTDEARPHTPQPGPRRRGPGPTDVHARLSRGADPDLSQRPGRRTQAGHGPVCRHQVPELIRDLDPSCAAASDPALHAMMAVHRPGHGEPSSG